MWVDVARHLSLNIKDMVNHISPNAWYAFPNHTHSNNLLSKVRDM